jgi:CRP/FNR family transcriptional regulator, cyclic AMP receptor protein
MEETLTLLEKTAFLKGIDLFAGVPTELLGQLAGRTVEKRFEAGSMIFREGTANTGLYMVVEGLVEVRRGRALSNVCGPGVGFGEMALGEGDPHQTTTTATMDTHVLCVSSEAFFETVMDSPELAIAVIRYLSTYIAEQVQRLHDLEGKIAHLNAALKEAGAEAPIYQSGAFRRPDAT